MNLHLDPQTPALIRAAASALLVLHIGGASAGLISGTVAMVAHKGGRLHRSSGNAFFVSMLIMASIGAAVSPFLPQRSNVVPGLLTCYLVVTAWLTVRRRANRTGWPEIGAFLLAVTAVAIGIGYGTQAMNDATGLLDHEPPEMYFIFTGLAAIGAALDLRMMWRGGLAGVNRTARHVWRMCLAFLIATASFFLGQQQVFPRILHGSPLMFLPPLIVLGAMIFWLIWIRFSGRIKPNTAAIGSVA